MAPSRDRLTYRVRGIAHAVPRHDVSRLLQNILNYDQPVTVHSLATTVDSFERPAPQVATVTFSSRPVALSVPDRNEWTFDKRVTSLPHNLTIDTHFYGFTVLNEVSPDDHLMECIAITGLGGHAYGSWSCRSQATDFMWLRDAVPVRYPKVRVLVYGYDTTLLASQSFQSIEDLSLSFISAIRAADLAEPSAKPTTLIAHSLGGIVVKQAFARMAGNPSLDSNFLSQVRQVLLFGVPNRGMQVAHLLSMTKDGPNKQFIETLAVGSEFLRSLDDQFSGLASTRNIELVSIYETHKTQVLKLVDDQWRQEGPWEVLVQRDSAIQRGTLDSRQLPLNKDHSNLVKFSETDPALLAILQFMKDIVYSLERDASVATADHNRGVDSTGRDNGHPRFDGVNLALGSSQEQQHQMEWERDKWRAEFRRIMIDNLNTYDLQLRFEAIESAHPATLSWAFTPGHTGLPEWLLNGANCFWICGKPGSGKSTIMKEIYEFYIKQSIQANLHRSPSYVVTARFFMSLRGTALQKSFEGLLRSLLYEILHSNNDLAYIVTESRMSTTGSANRYDWSLRDLEQAWDIVLYQRKAPVSVTLFLDALDEFDGPPEKIARFVENLVRRRPGSKTVSRICFASRPWNAFKDRFSHYDGFIVEEHSQADIYSYIWSIAKRHKAMQIVLEDHKTYIYRELERLLQKIFEQACGVFLWVKLVLAEILDQRAVGAEMSELAETIDDLPNELENLYEAILRRLRTTKDRREAYVMLEILARHDGPMMHYTFNNALKCATFVDIGSCREALRPGNSLSNVETDVLQRRVRSRCGGMIEFGEHFPGEGILIQLMHQSVKDFVLRPSFTALLLHPCDSLGLENGYSFMSKHALGRYVSETILRSESYWAGRFDWLHRAEKTTGRPQKALIDTIQDACFNFTMTFGLGSTSDKRRYFPGEIKMPVIPYCEWVVSSRLSFAIGTNLTIYIGERLELLYGRLEVQQRQEIIFNIVSWSVFQPEGTNPDHIQFKSKMLDRILRYDPSAIRTKRKNLTLLQYLADQYFNAYQSAHVFGALKAEAVELVRILLINKGEPNSLLSTRSLSDDHSIPFAIPQNFRLLHMTCAHPELLRTLLEQGADPNGLTANYQTALDITVIHLSIFKYTDPDIGNSGQLSRTVLSSQALIEYGAKVTGPNEASMVWLLRMTVYGVLADSHSRVVSTKLRILKTHMPAEFLSSIAWRAFVDEPELGTESHT